MNANTEMRLMLLRNQLGEAMTELTERNNVDNEMLFDYVKYASIITRELTEALKKEISLREQLIRYELKMNSCTDKQAEDSVDSYLSQINP